MTRRFSDHRPEKPIVDPLYVRVVSLMELDGRSNFAMANVSGLSTSTIANWRKKKVKRPQGVSLSMAARMLGYKIDLVKK